MKITKEQEEALRQKYSHGPVPEFEYARLTQPDEPEQKPKKLKLKPQDVGTQE